MTENFLVPFTFSWPHWGSHVQVAGDFDPQYKSWNPIDMHKDDGSPDYKITLNLQPGKSYHYKFVIDGNWIVNSDLPSFPDNQNNLNHVALVEIPQPESPLSSEAGSPTSSATSIHEQEESKCEDNLNEQAFMSEQSQEQQVIEEQTVKKESSIEENTVIGDEIVEETQIIVEKGFVEGDEVTNEGKHVNEKETKDDERLVEERGESTVDKILFVEQKKGDMTEEFVENHDEQIVTTEYNTNIREAADNDETELAAKLIESFDALETSQADESLGVETEFGVKETIHVNEYTVGSNSIENDPHVKKVGYDEMEKPSKNSNDKENSHITNLAKTENIQPVKSLVDIKTETSVVEVDESIEDVEIETVTETMKAEKSIYNVETENSTAETEEPAENVKIQTETEIEITNVVIENSRVEAEESTENVEIETEAEIAKI
ncbi:16763_t:CDS:2 [Acaulospora colombiana]|uniref:16763_t:CDS:1 n=1 Tax=Acaulospora colombiana TaxID=27376 RepID=A0ACA9MIA6_9GLOM|nr:16763_t:CDS:2 [Acaulospora colombiana]